MSSSSLAVPQSNPFLLTDPLRKSLHTCAGEMQNPGAESWNLRAIAETEIALDCRGSERMGKHAQFSNPLTKLSLFVSLIKT